MLNFAHTHRIFMSKFFRVAVSCCLNGLFSSDSMQQLNVNVHTRTRQQWSRLWQKVNRIIYKVNGAREREGGREKMAHVNSQQFDIWRCNEPFIQCNAQPAEVTARIDFCIENGWTFQSDWNAIHFNKFN